MEEVLGSSKHSLYQCLNRRPLTILSSQPLQLSFWPFLSLLQSILRDRFGYPVILALFSSVLYAVERLLEYEFAYLVVASMRVCIITVYGWPRSCSVRTQMMALLSWAPVVGASVYILFRSMGMGE